MSRSTLAAQISLAALALSSLAGTAAAQCDVYRAGIPDFDQRRSALLGQGNWFCVPTSAVDIMGYIANNGYPQAMGGPRNWQDPANYDYESLVMANMGTMMGTGADHGTTGDGELKGWQKYLDIYVPGQFVLSQKGCWKSSAVSPYDLYSAMAQGCMVIISMAEWRLDANTGIRSRVGGHICALSQVYDACAIMPNIGFKDPWSDANIYDQSTFSTALSDCWPKGALFDNGNNTASMRTQYQLLAFTEKEAFLDGYTAVFPVFGLASGPVFGKVIIYVPQWYISGVDPKPPTTELTVPGGAPVRSTEISPDFNSAYVRVGSSRDTPARIYRFEPNRGEFVNVLDLVSQDGPMTFGRHGELFVVDGGFVKKYDITDGSAKPANVMPPPGAFDAMTYDDSLDEIVCLDTPGGRIVRFTRDLDPVSNEPLPTPLEGRGIIAISPADNAVWITGTGSHALHKLKTDPASGRPLVDETISLDTGATPTGLDLNSLGHVFYSAGGVIHEIEKKSGGGWAPSPNSLFEGKAVGTAGFHIARSRTNWEKGMYGEGDRNVLPDGELPEVIDCFADFDGNHFVNGDDFDAFAGAFDAGSPWADVNHDGFVNGDDFDAFSAAFDAGC